MLLPPNLLTVAVAKGHSDQCVRYSAVVVIVGIYMNRKPFILDGLTGAIEGAIGKEDSSVVRSRDVNATMIVMVVVGAELLVALAGKQKVAALNGLEAEETLIIGSCGVGFRALVAVAEPRAHLGIGYGFTAQGIEDESFHSAIAVALAYYDGKIAGPEAGVVTDIIVSTEVLIVAAYEVIKSLR